MPKRPQKARLTRADLLGILKAYILPVLASVVLAGASGSYAFARIVERARPDMALAIMPSLAPALAVKADQLVIQSEGGRKQSNLAQARDIAKRSLKASALNPQALRTLAVTQSRNLEYSRRLVATSLRVSRRDVGTQLLQIELAVAAGDVDATLQHYDQALKVKPSVGTTLFPILLSAVSDPAIFHPTRKLVSSGPEWLESMVSWALENPAYLPPLSRIVSAFPQQSEAMAPGYGQALVEALVQRNEFAEAFAVYGAYARQPTTSPLGGGTTYRPIDWAVADNYESGADVVERPKPHVRFFAEAGAEGLFLSRLRALRPGRYRIALTIDAPATDSAGAIDILTSCQNGKEDRGLSRARFRAATGNYTHEFTIPPQGCSFQWLRFSVSSSRGRVEGNLTAIKISGVGTGSNS